MAIADDEPLARKRVRMMLGRHPEYNIVAECRDGQEAVDALAEHEPDVLFLDVKMPGLDGFEVLEALTEAKRPAAVVFVTAFADQAVAAFDENAADFLLKPYDYDRFARALARVEQRLEGGAVPRVPRAVGAVLRSIARPRYAERFLVRGPKHLYFVKASDVEWLDAAANYVRLHAGGRVHFVRETMRQVAERLPPERFVRVHRSIIVNLDCIQRLEPSEHGEYVISMRDGSRVRSSRTHNEQLRALLR
ncbi:MAG: LytR/AlgR family response regulator transcription factor [Gemmatimonadales bacterium]